MMINKQKINSKQKKKQNKMLEIKFLSKDPIATIIFNYHKNENR